MITTPKQKLALASARRLIRDFMFEPKLSAATNVIIHLGASFCFGLALQNDAWAEAGLAAMIVGLQTTKFVAWTQEKLKEREEVCDVCNEDHDDETDCDLVGDDEERYDDCEACPEFRADYPCDMCGADDRGFLDHDFAGALPDSEADPDYVAAKRAFEESEKLK